MTPVTVITHIDGAVVGLVDEIAQELGHTCLIVRPYAGEALPDPGEVDAVVILGGPQAAYEDHPYLLDEERFLAAAVDAGVPVLAICLGSQVLARALGGTAQPGEAGLEAGIIRVRPSEAANGIDGEFFSFHSDSMTPPTGAEILAESDRYVQAWAMKSALAIQFHPEMTLDGVQDLLAVEGPKLERFGVDVAAVRADAQQYFATGARDSRVLLDRWFRDIAPARSRN
ncbi:MAG: type 1 glutamine amidotransferase [Pseudonocardia sp.]|nr:type 1 glutamine amidotransferase [Pseudonocardia sp.]